MGGSCGISLECIFPSLPNTMGNCWSLPVVTSWESTSAQWWHWGMLWIILSLYMWVDYQPAKWNALPPASPKTFPTFQSSISNSNSWMSSCAFKKPVSCFINTKFRHLYIYDYSPGKLRYYDGSRENTNDFNLNKFCGVKYWNWDARRLAHLLLHTSL